MGAACAQRARLARRRSTASAAEPSLTRALSVWESALGPEHPDVGMAVQNLAQVARTQGELDRAYASAERAIRHLHEDAPARAPRPR
jgi:ATP/maltotriose-dependent transcriptional regulator MalT